MIPKSPAANDGRKILLAVSGASGAVYPRLFLEFMKSRGDIALDVTASKNARRIFREETGIELSDLWPGVLPDDDFDVPYVSGSARWEAMVVLPCSMGTLGRIAHGESDSAITRAADVCLKERRPLVLVPRETPLSLIHLRNMTCLAEAGATLLPAMPAFYHRPRSVEEAALTVVGRVLDHLGIAHHLHGRWGSGVASSRGGRGR